MQEIYKSSAPYWEIYYYEFSRIRLHSRRFTILSCTLVVREVKPNKLMNQTALLTLWAFPLPSKQKRNPKTHFQKAVRSFEIVDLSKDPRFFQFLVIGTMPFPYDTSRRKGVPLLAFILSSNSMFNYHVH